AEAARHLLLRAGRGLRAAAAPADPVGHPPRARRVHQGRCRRDDRPSPRTAARVPGAGRPALTLAKEAHTMRALKTVAVALGITLAALLVIPLIVLALLFVWLKVTEEDDEEALELDQDAV